MTGNGGFFQELKRRNVFRVAAVYGVVGWLLVEVASVIFPTFNAPGWVMQVFTSLMILGFPVALVFAWAFEITPDGIKLERDVDRSRSITQGTGRKLDFAVIAILAAIIVWFAVDKFFLSGAQLQTNAGNSLDRRSIAVLPFANRSSAQENAQFFADGIHDDLLTLLANLGSMKVISRTSVMEYRDTTKNMKTIGEELGVATILEGGVQRAGNQVRINVQLIDAGTDVHIWAKTYDRTLTAETIFAIQSEMAASIAEQLEAALSPDDREILDRRPTGNLEAYNAYLMAGQFYARSGFDDLFQAENYYRKAIELDPDYAAAHTGLVRTYNQLADTGAITLAELREKAGPIAERAIALDDRSGGAWSALASLRFFTTDGEDVEEMFHKALALSPNNSTILKDYAVYLRKEGRYEGAIPYIEKGLAIDPLATDHLFELGRAHVYLGRFDEALAAFAKIRLLSPTNPQGYYGASGVHMTLGDLGSASVLQEQAATLDPDDYETIAFLAWVYMGLGDETSANARLGRALDKGPDQALPMAVSAVFKVHAGEYEEAVSIARSALQNQVDDRWGAHSILLRVLRDAALRSGDYSEASSWYRQLTPDLFADHLDITRSDVQDAVNLALLLRASGDREQADRLLDAVHGFADPTFGSNFYNDARGISNVHALAIAGRTEEAIKAFRVAVDNRFRVTWEWSTELNPNMESLRDDPRYQAMIAEIKTDMAAQLEQLRAKQALADY
ncbi:MAG: tetratricopeptide repeat protein [Proteobacteria bacterium]|nr:tetratricopeptide repeat protein [Pseudomonadota bacterium]